MQAKAILLLYLASVACDTGILTTGYLHTQLKTERFKINLLKPTKKLLRTVETFRFA